MSRGEFAALLGYYERLARAHALLNAALTELASVRPLRSACREQHVTLSDPTYRAMIEERDAIAERLSATGQRLIDAHAQRRGLP